MDSADVLESTGLCTAAATEERIRGTELEANRGKKYRVHEA